MNKQFNLRTQQPKNTYNLQRGSDRFYLLTSGKYPFDPTNVMDQFIQYFWTPTCGIVGLKVLEKKELLVFAWVGKIPVIKGALPSHFLGYKIKLVSINGRPKKNCTPLQEFQKFFGKRCDFYITPPVVLITGAAAGIGLALAKLLSEKDYRLILTARGESLKRLQKEFVESDRLIMRQMDVRKPNERKDVINEVIELWGGVDVLVNNAGISYRAVTEHMSETDEINQMMVNYFGPRSLAKLTLPLMRMKQRGCIINVSSLSGIMGMPTMGAYSASKHALEGAMESLWYEAKPWNITVAIIEPGFINSNGYKNVKFSPGSHRSIENPSNPYHFYYKNMGDFVGRWMRNSFSTSESVAKIIFKTMNRANPPLRISATLDSTLFNFIRKILPEFFLTHLKYLFLPKENWKNIAATKWDESLTIPKEGDNKQTVEIESLDRKIWPPFCPCEDGRNRLNRKTNEWCSKGCKGQIVYCSN